MCDCGRIVKNLETALHAIEKTIWAGVYSRLAQSIIVILGNQNQMIQFLPGKFQFHLDQIVKANLVHGITNH